VVLHFWCVEDGSLKLFCASNEEATYKWMNKTCRHNHLFSPSELAE